jgi:hypothetical protein
MGNSWSVSSSRVPQTVHFKVLDGHMCTICPNVNLGDWHPLIIDVTNGADCSTYESEEVHACIDNCVRHSVNAYVISHCQSLCRTGG